MPRSGSDARAKLVIGAADMLRRRGFAAASVREVAKRSGAPLGSTYHYFPEGKAELAAEAVRLADRITVQMLTDSLAEGPVRGLAAFVDTWRMILVDSDFEAGCPVVAVAVDASPDAAAPRAAAATAFEGWAGRIADALADAGVAATEARTLAALIVTSVEGAVVVCRATRSTATLDDVGVALDRVVAAALRDSPNE
ncbi:TetR/AcrR family transcriptional regulator [Tsukamurella pseudospumae]|uniref:TetR family transcriptional regulator n=1 Tax=Tsukamurella pseudospumae TaxID=239498 RepID=A0A138A0Q4_9ACTN|nr:TetR/AcrR family transcriptional regulator [Tsukamurella pseudospumae]KXO88905.1 TetR family transcriptional regulator [Tsukamurella pseudospumae]KXP04014.1 TetR family transcriptional regulator [Tsukamurella pseudospumae]